MVRLIPLVVLLACASLLAAPAQAPSRLVVVSDIHGDYAVFVQVLQQAGVIDGRRKWAGGRTVFVQTGDVPDRGPHSRKIMDLLMDLEKQAPRAGGRVHALLGNHEVMNMAGDLRYVTPEEYASYRSRDAEELRERVFLANTDVALGDDAEYRRRWMEARPLGWVELMQAFGVKGRYGRWLRRHDAVVKVGETLLMHGGLSPAHATLTVDEINERVRTALAADTPGAEPLIADEDGPLWYRGLALAPEPAIAAHVDALLAHHGVKRIVVGHTVTPGVVLPRLGGKVILNDVGLSAAYEGPPSSLLIEGDAVSVRHRGTVIPLPSSSDIGRYLEAARAVEPPVSRLRAWMAQGARWPPPASAPPPAAP